MIMVLDTTGYMNLREARIFAKVCFEEGLAHLGFDPAGAREAAEKGDIFESKARKAYLRG
jgi:hypothetical protein